MWRIKRVVEDIGYGPIHSWLLNRHGALVEYRNDQEHLAQKHCDEINDKTPELEITYKLVQI